MIVRVRRVELLAPLALGAALIIGGLAATAPAVAVGAAAGLVFAFVVFADLAVGFAMLGFLSFLEVLPTSGGLSLAKGAGLLLAGAWVVRLCTNQRERDFFADYPPLTWTLVAFVAWAALTIVWATQTAPVVQAVSRYIPNVLLLPIAFTALRTRRDLTIVLGAIMIGAIVAAAFGILKPPNPSLVGEEAERATGTIGDPNELAAALLVGLALGAGFALSRGSSVALRLGGLAAIPICAAGIFLSLSRGGLVALVAVLVAGTVLAGRWRAAITGLLILVATSGVLYFTQIASLPARERVTTADGGSGRSDLWTIGLRMVYAHPIGGVGAGNFPIVSANYVLQPGLIRRSELIFSAAPKITHNTYLQVFAEMGAVGFILFATVVLTCLLCALRAARLWSKRNEVGMEALARGALLALIGLLVADFFLSETYGKLLWMMLALGPAMLALARREGQNTTRSSPG
ncbi:MAG TPA: O-antigen ligase family protein [Solirubrobacteraceae bacterium]|jgi:O-antigen ligase